MRKALVVAVLSAALSAGCGDDALSESEYRAEARKICTEAQRASRSIQQPTRTTNAAIADYFGRLVEVNKRTRARFEELEPPDTLKDAHDDAVAANEEGVQVTEELVRELQRGGDARALLQDTQSKLPELTRKSGEAARRLGVPECARAE